ncbi:MAG: VWA-like domain-containing protein [Burkholderiales bacterium]|nr:VWA-like domain-containing protein [Burkholderiales bacterium]
MAATPADVARKLHAARARLVLERPFIGALVLHLPLVPSLRTRSLATDGAALHFNPDYVASLDFAGTQFALAHEALHCALGHFARGRHRIRRRWDLACDYAVNQLLVDDGMAAPPGALLDARFRGLAAEEIYALVSEDEPGLPLDDHWFGSPGASPAPPESSAGTRGDASPDAAFFAAHRDGFEEIATRLPATALADAWRDRLAAAAHEAAQAGRLPAHWRDRLGRLAQPQLPWRALLERFLVGLAREDYGYARPSRREGPAILPGLTGREANLVVALDTSGSIDRGALAEFAAEVDALKGRVRSRVTLLFCDAAIAGAPLRFEPWEAITLPETLAGGGGTRFTPVFDWIAAEPERPDALVYFTDAQGEFPERAPDYPVLWIVTGTAPVPWGGRVQLN